MAFTKVYDMTWRSNNASGTIEIQQDGGSYETSLTLLTESLEIRAVLPSWEDQIIRQSCTFTIVNDQDDFFDIIPLMTMEDGKWKVVVTETSPDSAEHTLFEGFLNVETTSIPLLKWGELTLTASGYISKLKHVTPSSIDTIESRSLIDIIDDCLLETGASCNIRVNSSMHEENSPLSSGQTLFNRTGIQHEAFWEDNANKMSALEILEAILKTFNCYLYWYDGYWYIERYGDLNGTSGSYQGGLYYISRSYVEYTTGVSYGYTDTGAEVDISLVDWRVHNTTLKQADNEQKLSVSPGLKTLDIKLKRKNYTNLINPDLADITTHTTSEPLPSLRQWMGYTNSAETVGDLLDTLGLDPSIYFIDLDASLPNWTERGKPYMHIANSVRREGYYFAHDGYYNGLCTTFRASLYEITSGFDAEIYQSSLNIQFKFASVPYYMAGWNPYDEELKSRMEIYFYWYLRCESRNAYYFYDHDDEEWKAEAGSPDADHSNYIKISGSEIDAHFRTYDANIQVPIGDIIKSSVDIIDFTFCIGQERFYDPENPGDSMIGYPCMVAYYGDIKASISNSYKFNSLIRGELSSDFYDKKTISLNLFDDENWNLRNILLYGESWDQRTMYWGDNLDVWRDSAEGGIWDDTTRTVAKYLMEEKFKLYSSVRQKIKIHYKAEELFRPLQRFTDDKQSDMRFILCSETFRPESDIHKVELREYDDNTVITFD